MTQDEREKISYFIGYADGQSDLLMRINDVVRATLNDMKSYFDNMLDCDVEDDEDEGIVHCGECKWGPTWECDAETDGYIHFKHHKDEHCPCKYIPDENFFCGDGERRDE